jgi:hypothetical protein
MGGLGVIPPLHPCANTAENCVLSQVRGRFTRKNRGWSIIGVPLAAEISHDESSVGPTFVLGR